MTIAFDIGLAFAEGFGLIVSACILPVLPLVLATSASGGRRRPYGIIIGFVLAFSLFAILARKIVAMLGVELETLKHVSLVLLALLGAVLLSSKLSDKFSAFTQGLATFGNRLALRGDRVMGDGEGLLSGIAIGALIGLIWTPCAGPILAAALVQVIRQRTDLASNLVIVSFGIGAGLPMLLIALTGRKLMDRLAFFTLHERAIRRTFGVLILISVVYVASGLDTQSLLPASSPAEQAGEQLHLVHGLNFPYAAPKLVGIETWLNSPSLSLSGLEGKVVLVDFWTYSCINCVRTLPYLEDWDKKYRDMGLVIIGVHSPEFEFEKNIDNVKAAVEQYGIRYPVALDNNLDTWVSFENRYWPAHYLINRNGQVVYIHAGEGDYDITENNIRYLLGLTTKGETIQAEGPSFAPGITPETYLGYGRAANFGGMERLKRDSKGNYRFPPFLPSDQWALSGIWKAEHEKITSAGKGALRLNFKARKVFLVLGNAGKKPLRLSLKLNGAAVGDAAGKDAANGVVNVDRHTLYELIDQKVPKNSLLEIDVDEPGLEAYAFTFG